MAYFRSLAVVLPLVPALTARTPNANNSTTGHIGQFGHDVAGCGGV